MTEPTKEPLRIILGALDASANIPFDTVRMDLERGNRVPVCSFTVEDAAIFNITRWQTVLVMSPDGTQQYFFGYVTDYSLKKRGITKDYDVTCSSVEVRLQKAILDTVCTGTDSEIISCMFSSALPDLTGLFDLTGITDVRLDDLEFPFQDSNLLDGLDSLANKVDAYYSQTRNETGRVNINRNPNMDDDGNGYGADIPADSGFTGSIGTWPTANTNWNVGGYMTTVSYLKAALQNVSFLRIGSSSDIELPQIAFTFPPDLENEWISMKGTINCTSGAGSVVMTAEALVYDEDNNFVKSLGTDLTSEPTGSAQTFQHEWELDNAGLSGVYYVVFIINILTTTAAHDTVIDNIIIERLNDSGVFPTQGDYFDGDAEGAFWTGAANASVSIYNGKQAINWGDTPPDSPYDIDIGTTDFIGDLELEDMAFDGINTVVVTGGFVYVDVDWEYPSDAQLTHFDLEESVFPAEGATYPLIYKNTGSDVSPTWTAQTVGNRIDDVLGAGGITVLYEQEKHWVEFETAPADLKRGWRVVGRIKQRIRAVVEDELQVGNDGLQLVAAVYDETIDNEADAFEFGLAELARRAGTRRVTFTTYEPGLLPGQEIDIVDSAQGINETLIIERVSKKYLGGGAVMLTIEAGDHNPDLGDMIYQNNEMATKRPPLTASTLNQALTQLYDDDNLPLFDDDNAPLYDSTGL